ncbi:peptidoglycan glycosyltransferase [Sulfuricella denitrificans skB26]|uniref:Peptidoglycan D,D-transpeptidase FtsI n=1 Tax=Sulfuricella denitrificans (strain DSM 22764 / NBRC 105220 / skB26) TaxID=1163617 RepID=S6AD98_SULDS|nr:penicillin-binding protein 2 [Sulfuricella denitrificans]BAN36298.1 peptidoglycan glycosyltransferase [Sulfuricella denitrificans skB26]
MSYGLKGATRGRSSVPMLKLPAGRASILLWFMLAWFLILIARALYLQGLNNDFLRQKGDARYSRVIELTAHRGMITDRNGEPLAISTPVESVWVSPKDFEITPARIRQLSKILEMSESDVKGRFTHSQRDFIYLKRQVPPETAARVMQVDAPGVFLQREYRRYYPAGDVVAHLLGFTGVDDNGQEGLELTYQDWLAGKPGSRHVIKDRLGRIVEDVESIRAPQDGHDLALSIDRKIQYLAYRELKAAVTEHKAKAGAIVVLDAKTGEILALANLPAYNPNNRAKLNRNSTRNRAVTDTFEPGSTFKPFTAAAVLETGKFKPDTPVQTAPGTFTIGSATIHDAHPNGVLTVAQVIQKSSNVGAAKMALTLEPETLWNTFDHLGFGKPPHAGFPGEASGRLRPYKSWRPIEQATMAYGHGISVSLLQLARSYMVFTGDGEIRPVSLIKVDAPPAGVKVITSGTSQAVRSMLELVVLPGGTAPRAQVMGYRVAGKTGTAHKEENGHYASDKYIASFVGLAPASNPRLIVAVMIDEPSNGQYYGGAVAAPVFSQVMSGALRLLSVPPDAPTSNILPLEGAPEVKEVV